MKFNVPGIPPVANHPLWARWLTKAFSADRRHYGVPGYFHHYISSYSALMSILASQTLWASDVRSLEDTTEFEHGIPICNDALDTIREPSLREHVALVKQGLAERFRNRTFVACFSTRNDLQSQWDMYADEQRGFVATFDALVVSALESPQGYMLMPVEYGPDAQVARARRAVERALDDLGSTLPNLPARERLWSIQSRFVLLATEMFFFCASFKAPQYRPEHEWRLVYSRGADEENALEIQTRMSGARAIDYVTVDFTRRYAQDNLPTFAAVRVGPRTGDNAATLVSEYVRVYRKETRLERQGRF